MVGCGGMGMIKSHMGRRICDICKNLYNMPNNATIKELLKESIYPFNMCDY